MICPNCQKETPAANCCMHCGAVLNTTAAPEAAQPPKKKKGGAVIGIIAVIIAVICIVASFIPSGPTGNATYEMTEEDGSVSTFTYYYENDVVYKMVEVYTMSFADGLSDTDADLIEAQLDLEFAKAKSLSFCTIVYTHDETSFTITATYNDMDNIENLNALEDSGLIELDGEEGTLVSYKETKEGILSEGYSLVSENNN